MKNAFSMIELIFVIVIIGILAIFAIPKLSLTSKEAKGTRIAHDLSVCIMEAGSHFITQGTFGGLTQLGGNQTVSCQRADRCFDFIEWDINGSLKVMIDMTKTDMICKEAQRIAQGNRLTSIWVIHF